MQSELIRTKGTRVAFLDRDGVVNRDLGYVHRREQFEFLPGAIFGMRQLVRAGFALIVVTNQSGIARGYYDTGAFNWLTAWMEKELAQAGAPLLAVYHCPHHPDGVIPSLAIHCHCRKPEPGMLLRARDEHGINMADSIMVGDKTSDIRAGKAAGVGRNYLLASAGNNVPSVTAILPNLKACVAHLQEQGK